MKEATKMRSTALFSLVIALTSLLLLDPAFSQASFTTPNGQIAPGAMILVPAGPIESGQPVAAPPGPQNPLPVYCTIGCSPSSPIGASSNPVNGTIASTSTFQTLITINAARKGCRFQNQSTMSHNMYFSVASVPSLANSEQVVPGAFFNCAVSGNVIMTDTVSITGTSGDAFAGEWQ